MLVPLSFFPGCRSRGHVEREREGLKHQASLLSLWSQRNNSGVATYCLFYVSVVRTQTAQFYVRLELLVVFERVCLRDTETQLFVFPSRYNKRYEFQKL